MRPGSWAAGFLLTFQALVGSTVRSGPERLITCMPKAPFARGSLGDDIVRGQVPLTAENVILAGDGRAFSPCVSPPQTGVSTRADADVAVILRALQSRDPRFRRLAVIAQGQVGQFFAGGPGNRLMFDSDASVRIAVADALANALLPVTSDLTEPLPPTPEPLARIGRNALERMARAEEADPVAGVILESLGRLRLNEPEAAQTEQLLLEQSRVQSPLRALGAVKGLEAFVRANPRHALGDDTRRQLRELSSRGRTGVSPQVFSDSVAPAGEPETLARIRRLAMIALQSSRDTDVPTVIGAAADPDWQVRRLAVLRMDATLPSVTETLNALIRDEAFQVRLEVAKVIARAIARSKACGALVVLADDPAPQVAMQALDLLPAGCNDGDRVAEHVAAMAEGLRAGSSSPWHVPARALAALARMKAPQASELNRVAILHPAWQVRAIAAAVAADLADEPTVVGLAGDPEANVRNAALEALARMKSPALVNAAIAALGSNDVQLLRTASLLLKPQADRGAAVNALFDALDRLTRLRRDTSRDARVAIIERIRAIAKEAHEAGDGSVPAEAPLLRPYCDDVDPKVATLALSACPSPDDGLPPSPQRWRHYPQQPGAADLQALPRVAIIRMADGVGTIELELLGDAAPVTVARFVKLARERYYDGLTFHRIVPNFVIQGGSPGANEYVGDKYYMRDETGPTPHLRGSVGISTRGRDTGDAQIFIDLVDVPRLDHDYTVFARVTRGLDVVDRILEGAKIETITVR